MATNYIIVLHSTLGRQRIDVAKDRIEADYLVDDYSNMYGPTTRITYEPNIHHYHVYGKPPIRMAYYKKGSETC